MVRNLLSHIYDAQLALANFIWTVLLSEIEVRDLRVEIRLWDLLWGGSGSGRALSGFGGKRESTAGALRASSTPDTGSLSCEGGGDRIGSLDGGWRRW